MWTEGRVKAGAREEGVPMMRASEGSRAFLGEGGWPDNQEVSGLLSV